MITWLAAEVTDRAGDVAMIQFSIADHAVIAKVVVELVAPGRASEPLLQHEPVEEEERDTRFL